MLPVTQRTDLAAGLSICPLLNGMWQVSGGHGPIDAEAAIQAMLEYHEGAGERMAGWIAVLGPTRMRYEKAAPAVHFTARALSEALTRIGLA